VPEAVAEYAIGVFLLTDAPLSAEQRKVLAALVKELTDD
jgi:hypothetical protein